jgi:hypothetical protein
LTELDPSRIIWRRSNRCESGACVEVAAAPYSATASEKGRAMALLVRDSTNPTGPILELSASGWARFTSSIKRTR